MDIEGNDVYLTATKAEFIELSDFYLCPLFCYMRSHFVRPGNHFGGCLEDPLYFYSPKYTRL